MYTATRRRNGFCTGTDSAHERILHRSGFSKSIFDTFCTSSLYNGENAILIHIDAGTKVKATLFQVRFSVFSTQLSLAYLLPNV